MSQPVKLPDQLLEDARRHASLCSRSVPEQIEYWSRIGKVAEENPDLPYGLVKAASWPGRRPRKAPGRIPRRLRPVRVVQTRGFRNRVKRLHPKQKQNLDEAVRAIAENPP